MKYLKDFFDQQKQLMDKFHHIEVGNFPELKFPSYDLPLNLEDQRAQSRLKEYAWRITEELVECEAEYHKFAGPLWEERSKKVKEELIDALHFLIEFYIAAGIKPEDLETPLESRPVFLDNTFTTFMVSLGECMNLLKNRPWKQKHTPVDRDKFVSYCREMWYNFLNIAYERDMNNTDIYHTYLSKHQENESRIERGV